MSEPTPAALHCIRRECTRRVVSLARDYYDDEGGYDPVLVCQAHAVGAEPASLADAVDYLRRSQPMEER